MEHSVEQLLVVQIILLVKVVSGVAIGVLEAIWDLLFAEVVWAVYAIQAGLELQVGLVLQVVWVQAEFVLVQVEFIVEAEWVLQVVLVLRAGARAVGQGWLGQVAWSPYFYL